MLVFQHAVDQAEVANAVTQQSFQLAMQTADVGMGKGVGLDVGDGSAHALLEMLGRAAKVTAGGGRPDDVPLIHQSPPPLIVLPPHLQVHAVWRA